MRIEQNDFDLFLTWASYKASGYWRDWRNAISNWKQDNSTERNSATRFAWQARYAFSALGHVDFDPGFHFQSRGVAWQAAPPALAVLPDDNTEKPIAVLCGRRCENLVLKLQESLGGNRVEIIPQQGGPHCIRIRFDNEKELNAICQEFEIANAGGAAKRLLRALPQIETWLSLASEQSCETPFACFNLKTGKWEKNTYTLFESENTLVRKRNRFESHKYYFKYLGKWLHMPWQYGFCLASKYHHEPLFFYNLPKRELELMQPWIQLPALYLRCLVLCSGLLPHFCHRKRTLSFKNVPFEIATGLAQRLNQPLEKIDESS